MAPPGQNVCFKDWLKTDPAYPGRLERILYTASAKINGIGIDAPFFDENVYGFEKWNAALNFALVEVNRSLTFKDVNGELAKDTVTFAGLLCAAIMEPFIGITEASKIYEFCRNGVQFPMQAVAPPPAPGASNPPTVQSSVNTIKAAMAAASQVNPASYNPFVNVHPRLKGTATVTGIDKISNCGCVCKKCNTSNEYAAPNQDDGTYICFGCR